MAYRDAHGFFGNAAQARGDADAIGSCNDNCRSGEAAQPLSAEQKRLLDWVESQCGVTQIWLDRLVATGDPEDLVSLIHKQAAWLDLVRSRLSAKS